MTTPPWCREKVMVYYYYYSTLKGVAHLEMAKSHVFVLMQISYPYIVWNIRKIIK